MKMTRRQFLGTAVVTTAARSDDGGGADANNQAVRNCAVNGTVVTIEANHGHTLTVSASDVSTGTDKTYDITGSGGHSHMVTITANNFATLQSNANGTIMVTSTSAGHTHIVRVNCAAA